MYKYNSNNKSNNTKDLLLPLRQFSIRVYTNPSLIEFYTLEKKIDVFTDTTRKSTPTIVSLIYKTPRHRGNYKKEIKRYIFNKNNRVNIYRDTRKLNNEEHSFVILI